MQIRPSTPRAFTLIELLIVVAIIAILAAIAVPNFLEAQTRAKVSRSKADMRSTATAVESYRVDNNRYPIPSNKFGEQVPIDSPDATPVFTTKTSIFLTTPIAYITTRFNEPFPALNESAEDAQYHLGTLFYYLETTPGLYPGNLPSGFDNGYDAYMASLSGNEGLNAPFYMLGHGPDSTHNGPGKATQELYDPTNGTISNGDIVYFGSGTGFLN